MDNAPGAPQQRSQLEGHAHHTEIKELQRRFSTQAKPEKPPIGGAFDLDSLLFHARLDEEMQQRLAAEEQLMATQDRLKRYRRSKIKAALCWNCIVAGSGVNV